ELLLARDARGRGGTWNCAAKLSGLNTEHLLEHSGLYRVPMHSRDSAKGLRTSCGSRHSLARRALWRWVDRVSGSEQFARKKFAVFVLVEPRALDVEQLEPGAVCEGERVDRELRNGRVGPSG